MRDGLPPPTPTRICQRGSSGANAAPHPSQLADEDRRVLAGALFGPAVEVEVG
jgi:hypothetical protein